MNLCGSGIIGNIGKMQCFACPPNEYANFAHSQCLSDIKLCDDGTYGDNLY